MDSMTELLYVICNFLLLPVLATLLLFMGWVAVLSGGFLREYLSRKAERRNLNSCLTAAKQNSETSLLWSLLREGRGGMMTAFSSRLGQNTCRPEVLTHAIEELEHDLAASLSRLSFLTRVGPMLGLMGTLIPLGPALTGLSSGDTHVMAQNLVVAFTATVVGVLIGTLAYGIGLVRRSWYGRDISDLEFICQHLSQPDAQAKQGAKA